MTPHEIGERLAAAAGANSEGTPDEAIAAIAAEAWTAGGWNLPDAEDALWALFEAGREDSLVAVGLLSANMPDKPDEVIDLARRWLNETDDLAVADALGWIVIGPCCLALGADLVGFAIDARAHPRAVFRRAAVMSAMALLPIPIAGPAAGPLRARAGEDVQFVESAVPTIVSGVIDQFKQDRDPVVREALQRVLTVWRRFDPQGVNAWLNGRPMAD